MLTETIAAFYDRGVQVEWSRMDRHPLEFGVSRRHIDALLAPSSRILDLGGGPGRYSFHYAAQGHRVSLVDLSPGNIDFARAKQAELGLTLERCETGDARDLPQLPDATFDLVLCMGPLYHLVHEADRIAAIAECRRLVRPGGHIVFAFITVMAQTIAVLQKYPERLSAWQPSLEHAINQGRNDTSFDTGFTEAFLADPLAVGPFIQAQGLAVLRVVGAEGGASQSEETIKNLPPAEQELWFDFLYRHSGQAATLGGNQHILAIARRAGIPPC